MALDKNPATAPFTGMPPALLADLHDNPDRLQPIARAMGAINLEQMFQYVSRNPDCTFAQRLAFQELVNKMGRLLPEPKAAPQGGSGFSLKIVVGNDQQIELHAAQEAPAIESTAVHISDE